MPSEEDCARMEREYRDARTADVLAVDRCLTPEERALFLTEVYNRMPRLNGAHVADILDIWDSADAFLGLTEPFWEAHAAELDGIRGARFALYAALVLDEGSLNIETVRGLARPSGSAARRG